MLNGKVMIITIKLSQYFPEPCTQFDGNIKIKVDFF